MVWGLLAAALGMATLAFVGDGNALVLIVIGTVVMSLGMAPVFTVGNELILTAAPPERAGAASAVSEMSAELSGALGIAVLGTVGTILYRYVLDASLPPEVAAGVPADALGTLGGAVALASTLPAPDGSVLLSAGRAAFGDALQFIAVVGAATVLLASYAAARLFRPPVASTGSVP